MADSVAAAASYLPDSIQNKVRDYLPSPSDSDAHPSKKTPVGVGDLPGGDNESGVVVLPAERTSLPTSFEERLGAQPGEHSDGVGSLPGKDNESGVALLPAERTTLPSSDMEKHGTSTSFEERLGVQPGEHSGGVGSLPGKSNESGVALLPTERRTLPSSDDERRGTQPGEKVGGVGALPGKASEEGIIPKFEETAAPQDGASHRAVKPGFASKLKGEVKIIQGKLSHNEDKIEAGRKLKTGSM